MLQDLPTEVLRIITTKLNFKTRLALCKTCRKLYEKISRTNLYETLCIRKNTEEIIKLFQDKKLDGTHVKILDIDIKHLSDELYSNLANIFPNLIRFKTNGNRFCYHRYYYPTEAKKREDRIIKPLLLHYKDVLKQYHSVDDWMYLRDELFRSSFPKLENLSIWKASVFPGRKEGFDPLFLSKAITNAPMLTRLHISECDVSIDSLEEIHKGCPFIRSLELSEVMLVIDDNSLLSSIIPAIPVLKLKAIVSCFDKYGLLLEYIVNKYPNLQDLDIFINNINRYETLQMLGDYYSGYRYRGYRLVITEESGEHERICENRTDELRPTVEAYQSNSASFFSRLSKSIKVLELQLNVFDNVMEEISGNTTSLSSLKLASYDKHNKKISIKSNQLGYFKDFNSLNFLHVFMESSVQSCGLDFISNTITKLDIALIDAGFYLNWLISMFPSLESLIVESKEYLLVDENNSNSILSKIMYPRLHKLNLENCKLYPESLNYMKTVLPNVEGFMYSLYIDEKTSYHADFTGWNSNKLYINMVIKNFNQWDYETVVSTPKNIQHFSYRGNPNHPSRPQEEPEIVDRVARVNISYDNTKAFILNGKKMD